MSSYYRLRRGRGRGHSHSRDYPELVIAADPYLVTKGAIEDNASTRGLAGGSEAVTVAKEAVTVVHGVMRVRGQGQHKWSVFDGVAGRLDRV